MIHISGAIPLTLRSSYPPTDSPPPYPGGYDAGGEEKVPLSETQFVNCEPEDSPQRFQTSPLLPSPGDQSPSTCRAVLSNFNGNHVVWAKQGRVESVSNMPSNDEQCANHMHHKEDIDLANVNVPMQGSQTQTFPPGAAHTETNGIAPPSLSSGSESSTAQRQTSNQSSPEDMVLFQKVSDCNTHDIRQNSNNEQRQLYNMVIVGVEPDLTHD